MRMSAVFASLIFAGAFLFAMPASAAGPEDLYLEAYRLIQEGDQYQSAGRAEMARSRYDAAKANLNRLKEGYPSYQPKAVEFRLEYIQGQLSSLPGPAAAPTPKPAERPAPSPGEQSLDVLKQQVAQLQADNALLQAKLQEAMAARPAAVDPQELARAQEEINRLEKEKELLQANLAQVEARKPDAPNQALLDQARSELEATKKKLVETTASVALLAGQKESLETENAKLKEQLTAAGAAPKSADLEKAVAEAQNRAKTEAAAAEELRQKLAETEKKLNEKSAPVNEKSRVKELENERDDLLKKLNAANRELYDVKARGQLAQFETLTNQMANLRARLEVFEARKVPFSQEELALMDAKPKLVATADAKPTTKRATRELPAGSALIIGEAERAFASRRFQEAEEKYKKVLEMDPENPVSLANLATIQLELEKIEEAEKNLKKALEASPEDAVALSLMGMVRFRQSKFNDALDLLSRSAQMDPKNPETQNYLGVTLSQLGQREAAETALRKAIQLAPGYGAAHLNLAVIYASQKPPFTELAKYHYNKALAAGHPPHQDLEKELQAAGK